MAVSDFPNRIVPAFAVAPYTGTFRLRGRDGLSPVALGRFQNMPPPFTPWDCRVRLPIFFLDNIGLRASNGRSPFPIPGSVSYFCRFTITAPADVRYPTACSFALPL
jgi:hypothetical protein